MLAYDRRVVVVGKNATFGTGGLGFDSRAGQIGYQRRAIAATFLRSCVAQALSREDGFLHSLLASV